MKLFKKRNRLFWSLLLSAFVMVCLNVRAADDDDDEEEEGETDWHVERAKLEAEIERSVQKRLEREVTEEKVINGLSRTIPQLAPWTSPVRPPELTKDEVEEELMKEIMKEVKVKFPDSRREEFKGEAEEKYKMWKRNDDVQFVRFFCQGEAGVNHHVFQAVSVQSILPADQTKNRIYSFVFPVL